MRRILPALTSAGVLLAFTTPPASADELFRSALRGNIANQEIAGFPASTVTWDIERGRASVFPFGEDLAVVVIRTRGLIIPAFGFNPSPDILARIVCHDEGGAPHEAARTRTAPFSPQGDAKLVDVVSLPESCFAPIVLLTGSRDPEGNTPGKWFAVSAF